MLLVGVQAQHVLPQDLAAVKEVGQGDVGGDTCDAKKKKKTHVSGGRRRFWATPAVRGRVTRLAGADVERPGEGAVLGDLGVPAEAVVVGVVGGGGQGVGLQGEPEHLDASQGQAPLEASRHGPGGRIGFTAPVPTETTVLTCPPQVRTGALPERSERVPRPSFPR